MKSVHFGDRPSTLPHEDRTQRKEVEREESKGDNTGSGGTEKRGEGGREVKVTAQGAEGRRKQGTDGGREGGR